MCAVSEVCLWKNLYVHQTCVKVQFTEITREEIQERFVSHQHCCTLNTF